MFSDEATIQSLRRDLALQVSRIALRLGETQVAAARRLGIPQPTLSKINNGRVSDLSIEFLLRIAVRAGIPMTLQTGRDAAEAGAFVWGLSPRDRAHAKGSKLAAEARGLLVESERSLTPGARLEAFLEHNQLVGALHQAALAAEERRVPGAPGGA
jgi:transcriptional regulator with XRE-family HTH domain